MRREFIYDSASFPECHASTLAETSDGLVAAWFGGTGEGNPDVEIWMSRKEVDCWTAPARIADGLQADGSCVPCWNPVLFQYPDGPLMLFYKVGPSVHTWWGMLKRSEDAGKTWSEAVRLPDGILGPIKNKPVLLSNGELLCPSSIEISGNPKRCWQVQFETTGDFGKSWRSSGPVNDGMEIGAIQPSVLFTGGNTLLSIGRTLNGRIFRISSDDLGQTWGPMSLTTVPNPNSGIDAVTLQDGRHMMIYNHTEDGRSPINLAISLDGDRWQTPLVIEDEPDAEFSYPAIIQTRDELVHITYTWKRTRIRHFVIDPKHIPFCG